MGGSLDRILSPPLPACDRFIEMRTVRIAAALALASFVKNVFFGVSPRGPSIFGFAGIVMAATALAACALPARRAARLDPWRALRE